MRSTPSLQFEHIDSLHIFDLKAQKKNINYKKFFNMPLSFEEQIADHIQAERACLTQTMAQTQTLFKVRKQLRVPLKKIEKLSHPRKHQENVPHTYSSEQLVGIIKKCDRLKNRLLTDKKLCRFEKDSSKCYDYLFELSNFNFQKYESD